MAGLWCSGHLLGAIVSCLLLGVSTGGRRDARRRVPHGGFTYITRERTASARLRIVMSFESREGCRLACRATRDIKQTIHRPWENRVTEFVVTTIDGRQFRASSVNARLSSLVGQCSTKLAVRPSEPEHSGRETNTVFFKHGIISISEGSQVQSDLPADKPVSA